MKIPPSILRYWAAMNASAAQSAAHAVKAFVATATAHAISGSIPALNLPQLSAVFMLAFMLAILDWLDAHPLTDLLPPPPAANQPQPHIHNEP